MPKNVVVCCDGTANEFKRDRTNVVKLFQTLIKDPALQACYYHPGVGTMATPGFVTKTGAKLAEFAGLALGYGLRDDIADAYTFITRNYEPGDKLFLFGFSRGAYSARALASLLRMYGLIPRNNDRLVPYAIRMMWAIHQLQATKSPNSLQIKAYFELSADFKSAFSRECKPHFVGVWDTVSSVGWVSSPLSLPYTANNPDISIGRHAIAIDEVRAFFRTNLWRPTSDANDSGPKDLLQVWFPGVHSDVGGGYPEAESGLAKIALKWMIDESRIAGLLLDGARVAEVLGQSGSRYAPPDPNGVLHKSMTKPWRLAEYVRRPRIDKEKGRIWRANHFKRRSWPSRPIIHDAAWLREGGNYAACFPKNAVRLSDVMKERAAANDKLDCNLTA